MGVLSRDRLDIFLKDSSIVGILATIDSAGEPYLVPIWFEWDGSSVWMVSKPKARYVDHIKNNSKVSICIAKAELPYVRAVLAGPAELIETDRDWLPMGYRMAERYIGGDSGQAYIDKTAGWKRVFIRLTPDKISSWDGGAEGHDWGKRFVES